MKKLFVILLITILCSGCSLFPRLTFSTPNTVPQSVDKSKVKETCKGKAEWDENGNIKSCSKGYYRYDEGYNKKERRMTIVERFKSFINNLTGWSFWIFIVLIFLFPSSIGFIAGRIIEGVFGLAKQALTSTVKGVQIFRKTGKDINDALSSEQDEKIKQYIRKLKEEENIK